jgi:hypothetical protein
MVRLLKTTNLISFFRVVLSQRVLQPYRVWAETCTELEHVCGIMLWEIDNVSNHRNRTFSTWNFYGIRKFRTVNTKPYQWGSWTLHSDELYTSVYLYYALQCYSPVRAFVSRFSPPMRICILELWMDFSFTPGELHFQSDCAWRLGAQP